MRRLFTFAISALLIAACANPTELSGPQEAGTADVAQDTAVKDSSTPKDSSGKDVETKKDSSTGDATLDSSGDVTLADADADADADAGTDADADAGADAADADASDGSVVDGGTANDTCQLAVALTSGVTVAGDTSNANDTYDVNVNLSNACSVTDLSLYQFDGNDVAYVISVPNGKTLTAVVSPTGQWDPAITLVTDCGNIGPTCLGGDDSGGTGDPETGTFVNNTGQTQTVYVVVDSYSTSEYGPFNLTATVQ